MYQLTTEVMSWFTKYSSTIHFNKRYGRGTKIPYLLATFPTIACKYDVTRLKSYSRGSTSGTCVCSLYTVAIAIYTRGRAALTHCRQLYTRNKPDTTHKIQYTMMLVRTSLCSIISFRPHVRLYTHIIKYLLTCYSTLVFSL